MKTKEIRRFRKALRRFDRLQSRQLKDCCVGVTPAQCHILMELEGSGPITSGELARRLDIDASTLTRTADRLVERKLVARGPHPDDRRSLLVSLTRRGQSLCDDLNRLNDDNSRKIFAAIPDDRQLEVLRDFELLVEAMRTKQRLLAGTINPNDGGGCAR